MDVDREESCAPVAVPAGLSVELAGYAWARNLVGESGGAVYRLHGKSGAPDLYLKHGQGGVADDLADEMVRLRWMSRYMPVPAVAHFFSTRGDAWLVMTALPGETAYQALEARPEDGMAIVDRYQDLAVLWNCLGEFAGDLQGRFLTRYGVPLPDQRKLQFHLMLDELF